MLTSKEKFVSHYFALKRAHDKLSASSLADLAVILRLLLKDGFIHRINKSIANRGKLIFPVDINQDKIMKTSTFLAGFRLAVEPIAGQTAIKMMNIDDFMSFKILRVYEKEFSVSEFIDIVANKLGNAHYNPEQAAQRGLDSFDSSVFKAVVNVICRICQSVASACEKISQELIPVDYSQSFGHWMIDDGAGYFTRHDGAHWMHADLTNSPRAKGLSFLFASRFLPIGTKNAVVVEIEIGDNQKIACGYDWKGNVFIEFSFDSRVQTIEFETSNSWGTIGRMGLYCVYLEAIGDCIFGKLLFSAQGRVEYEEIFGTPIDNFCFDCKRIVIGADCREERGARMEMAELALFGKSEDDSIRNFARYLMAKYELV